MKAIKQHNPHESLDSNGLKAWTVYNHLYQQGKETIKPHREYLRFWSYYENQIGQAKTLQKKQKKHFSINQGNASLGKTLKTLTLKEAVSWKDKLRMITLWMMCILSIFINVGSFKLVVILAACWGVFLYTTKVMVRPEACKLSTHQFIINNKTHFLWESIKEFSVRTVAFQKTKLLIETFDEKKLEYEIRLNKKKIPILVKTLKLRGLNPKVYT